MPAWGTWGSGAARPRHTERIVYVSYVFENDHFGCQPACLHSVAEEAVIARVAAADMRTTTARNNKLILDNTGLDVRVATPKQVLEEMRLRETEMTSAESHTARLLTRALEQRGFLNLNDICTKDITDTIESLCTT